MKKEFGFTTISLVRTGTKSDIYNKHRGSIDVETRYGDIKNVTIEDNVFVAPFDTGVTDHLNPNGGILNHVEIRNNQTMVNSLIQLNQDYLHLFQSQLDKP